MQVTGLQASPLSMQQARLWSGPWQNAVSRTVCAVQISGRLEREVFRAGLQQVVERHEILRTLFYSLPGMDVPVQILSEDAHCSCPEISLAHLDTSEQSRRIDELFTALQEDACDLQHSPLFQLRLLQLAEEMHVLLISLPTLCADSWSLKLLVDELSKAYLVSSRGERLTFDVLQYADVSAWQEEMLASDEAEIQRQYWQKRDLSQEIALRLPFEADGSHIEKKANEAFAPYTIEIPLEKVLTQRVEMQALRCGASIEAWLLASFQVLLWRLSDEATFLVGVACNGRTHEDLANALGLYTRVVPLHAHFGHNRSFEFVLTTVKTSLQEAIKRQLYFTWDGVNNSGGSDAHFFPVNFEYETWPTNFEAGAVTFSLLKRSSYLEPFVLKLSALRVGERLALELHYDPQRISTEQISRLAEMFHTLLTSTVENPQAPVSVLGLLTTDEQNHLLTTFSAPTRTLPAPGLHRLFEAQVKRTPTQLAVLSAGEQLTYEQLNERANRLAQVLGRRGVGPNVLVGLSMARSAQMLVGLLGILKAGGAYLPLDVGNPPSRLTYQLQESQARLLLSQREVSVSLPLWEGITLCLEDLEQEMSEAPATDRPGGSAAEDLAYVIYTSGSTGNPKGVMISQGSVVNYTKAVCELLGVEPGWQYATVSTLAADLGNTAIFCALVSGGCVQVLDHETVTSVEAMIQWVERHPIDVLKIVPSHLSALLAGEQTVRLMPRQALVLGGEALPTALLSQLQDLRGTCRVYNHYGPTEATIGVLVHPLGVEKGERGEYVPVGKPITNTQVYVLDQRMQVVPVEMTGELYIGGTGLAMGYIRQAEQTAERFVPHPFGDRPGARLYRTGDLARYGESGQIEFVGRLDRQVKLRGYRIELGEIEACLGQHPQIRTNVVMLREDVPGDPRLVSYIVARQRMPLPTEQLREFLLQSLPEYMVPGMYVQIDALPLTANGKVDRQKLPVPDLRGKREQFLAGKPRNAIEEMLVEIWRDLLGVPVLGIHDDFFAVGGHSLMATRVMARVQAVLQVALPIQLLFEVPTVAGLAQRIAQVLQKSQKKEMPPLVAVAHPAAVPLSFAQQRLWFLSQLEPDSSAYLAARAWRFLGNLRTKALEQCVQELVCRHESLRTTFELRAEQPVQVIHPARRVVVPVIDLRELRPEQREREARWLMKQEAQCPCDLAKGPLLRTYLVRLGTQEHALLLTMHHIITDGWSNEVLVQELAVLYEAFAAGKSSPLVPLSIQYADYALWQRQWFQEEEILEIQLAYWRKQLADVSPLVLPTDASRLSIQTYHGAIETLQLSQTLSEGLVALSFQENVTLFMLLLATFQVLLLRYTGQTDISVGTPTANRARAELEGVVGFFANMLVVRTDLSDRPTFREVLKRVREVALGAYAHQDIPFEYLVEKLQPERNLSHSPLFQVTFQLAYSLAVSQQFPELKLESLASDGALADFDLGIKMIETEQGFLCQATYNTDLFKGQTVHQMLERWQILLESIVQDPQVRLSDLPLLTDTERYQLLVEWNATQCDSTPDLCVHQLFEQQVERTPEAIAVVFEDEMLTYEALNRRANQLARHLQSLGVGPDRLVGICIPRSLQMLVGLLAVQKSGGAYVPLDPTYPDERLAFMVADSGVMLILTHSLLADPRRSMADGVPVINLDTDWQTIALQRPENPQALVTALHLAYLIYTSGSTGRPKGTMVTHRNVTNFFTAMDQHFGNQESGRWLAGTSISFDISVLELFWTLSRGFLVVVQPDHDWSGLLRQPVQHLARDLDFSLFYFANDTEELSGNKYRLLLEGAKFADTHHFTAVWTPERHFHPFGGLYPNPSVTSAAIAAITKQVQIRAGSVVLPLHDPVRVAEEWAVVDSLSGGRVGLSFASGWHANDFVLAPEQYTERKQILRDKMETVRKLWQGEAVALRNPMGNTVSVKIYPQPIQPELPIWLTSSGNPETFVQAGEMGMNLLTHLLGQNLDELAEKIALYRQARQKHGHKGKGHVTLMVHTFVGTEGEAVREKVRQPFCTYLRSSVELFRTLVQNLGYDSKANNLSEEDIAAILAHGFDRYYETSALMGTVETCLPMIERLKEIGVDEVACLIDFGVEEDAVLASLHELAKLRQMSQRKPTVETLSAQIERLGITHFQCTPSQASLLLLEPERLAALGSLEHLLLGGEALPLTLVRQLGERVSGEIHNMYGPTETTIWSSTTCVDKNASAISLGSPIANTQMYVLDPQTYQLQPLGVAGELFVGGKGVARGYANRPELTAERFLPDPYSHEGGAILYRTGDKARYLPDGKLEHLGRMDQQIKLRGYRIEPGEIESVLSKHEAVRECVVTVKEDRLGQRRLVAYAVLKQGQQRDTTANGSSANLRPYLQNRLPIYMIPSAYVFLDALPLTPNGKVDRGALPMPEEVQEEEPERQIGPRTPIEELLVGIWKEVLGQTEIGIHDDFFERGGHSLLAAQLVARMRTTLSVEIPVRVIFETPTIVGLARRVEQERRKNEGIEVLSLLPLPRPEAVPLSFAQQRLWFLDQLYPGSAAYLNSAVFRMLGALNAQALERSLQEVVHRHEILRTTFGTRDGQPLQVIHPSGRYVLPLVDLQGLEKDSRTETAQVLARQEAQHACNLTTGPLLRTPLFRVEAQEHLFFLTWHHIITDGWSNRVLMHELTALYKAFAAGQSSPLASLPIQYADYALWQRKYLVGEVLQRYLAYWQRQLQGASPLELPTDAPRSSLQTNRGARYSFVLPLDLSTKLASLSRQEGVTLFVTLLTAFQVWLYRLTGQTDIVVGTDVANRTHVETEALLGFFINLLALRARLERGQLFRNVLQQVREHVLGAYTYQDFPFELLIEQLLIERKKDQTPLINVLFVLQNIPENVVKLPGIEVEILDEEHTVARFDLALFLQEEPERIRGAVVYRADLFAESTIGTWMRQFEMVLSQIVARPDTGIDGFSIDPEKEKRKQTREQHMKARSVRAVKARELEIE